MNILQIDTSVLGDNSVSRNLTASVVADLVAANPEANVTVRDLDRDAPAHLSGNLLPVLGGPKDGLSAVQQAELERTEQFLAEFLAADVLVLGVPQYNFGIPSQLKAWFDRIAQAGRTFKYTENGPVGLAGGKRERETARDEDALDHGDPQGRRGILLIRGVCTRPCRTAGGRA